MATVLSFAITDLRDYISGLFADVANGAVDVEGAHGVNMFVYIEHVGKRTGDAVEIGSWAHQQLQAVESVYGFDYDSVWLEFDYGQGSMVTVHLRAWDTVATVIDYVEDAMREYDEDIALRS